VSANYFRSLAVRCLTAARDCYDRRTNLELRKLADEFTAKANELEAPLHLSGVPEPRSDGHETKDLVEPGARKAY
jgi:hypothetical protein